MDKSHYGYCSPMFMIASGRCKPKKEYIGKVSIAVAVYFTVVAIISTLLLNAGSITIDQTWSYVYDTLGIGVLDWLYSLIPVPYFYLYPLFPFMVAFFYGLAWIFRKYKVTGY